MAKRIEKKILPEFYNAVRKKEKTFELRKDDSDYQVGDTLDLREWDGKKYTGNRVIREITYVLRNCPEYGLMPGYCILAIQSKFDMFRDKTRVVLDGKGIVNYEQNI